MQKVRLHWISGCSASGISCLREVHENKYLPSSALVNLLYPVWRHVSNTRTVFILCDVSRLAPSMLPVTTPTTWRAQGLQRWEDEWSRLVLLCHPWGPTCLGTVVPLAWNPRISACGNIDVLGPGAVPWGFGRAEPGETEIFVKLSIDSSCLESFTSLALTQGPETLRISQIIHVHSTKGNFFISLIFHI